MEDGPFLYVSGLVPYGGTDAANFSPTATAQGRFIAKYRMSDGQFEAVNSLENGQTLAIDVDRDGNVSVNLGGVDLHSDHADVHLRLSHSFPRTFSVHSSRSLA